ncbi:MAG: hypothetical protein HZC28_01955 [Spirochaetes bacterium]|nr:hypothetical protein [Spirochaetota bacterium]
MAVVVIVPISILLMASFFVLLGVQKAEKKSLKTFGVVIAILLWISSAVVFTGGMIRTFHGGPMMMHHMMGQKMMHEGRDMKGCPADQCPMMKDGVTKTAPDGKPAPKDKTAK